MEEKDKNIQEPENLIPRQKTGESKIVEIDEKQYNFLVDSYLNGVGDSQVTRWLTDEGLDKIYQWGKMGLNYTQVAYNMGIVGSTLKKWRRQFPEIQLSYTRGQEEAIQKVENALYKTALGYEYEETDEKYDGEGNLLEIKRSRRYKPASVQAQEFYLTNKASENWKKRQETELSGGLNVSEQSDKYQKYFKNKKDKQLENPENEEFEDIDEIEDNFDDDENVFTGGIEDNNDNEA